MDSLLIVIGKAVSKISKLLNRSGSTWPGHLALSIDSNFIQSILKKNKHIKIILIAGTNGKTTTTKALFHILQKQGIKAIHNNSGANLLNGFASLLIKKATFLGHINSNVILFEVDENSLPIILDEIKNPACVILLNLFRDQLDRYGEINITSEKWKKAIEALPRDVFVVSNADDPQIAFITKGIKAKTTFYSIKEDLKESKEVSHAADSIVCPDCRHDLVFTKIAYSHVGEYYCPSCKFKNPKSFVANVSTNLKGVYNIYNLTAALLSAHLVFNINVNTAAENLFDLKPAFGRQEEIELDGKKILILLSKNPTGFNESIRVVLENNYKKVLIILNDRIPDGRDISWIWDVDFELFINTKTELHSGGDRAYDLANRLYFADLKTSVNTDLRTLLHETIADMPKGEKLAILPTYSAMLDVRELLIGRKIL